MKQPRSNPRRKREGGTHPLQKAGCWRDTGLAEAGEQLTSPRGAGEHLQGLGSCHLNSLFCSRRVTISPCLEVNRITSRFFVSAAGLGSGILNTYTHFLGTDKIILLPFHPQTPPQKSLFLQLMNLNILNRNTAQLDGKNTLEGRK